MALHIRTENVKDHEELIVDIPMEYGGGRDLDGVTKTLGFASIVYGIPVIKDNNVDEVFRRVQAMEDAVGALMAGPGGSDVLFTRADIERRVGMSTNVSPITRAKFEKAIKKTKEEEARRKS